MTDLSPVESMIAGLKTSDGRFDLASDPATVTLVATALAERARPENPTVVLSWAGEDDSVLAHVVASELRLPRAVVELDLGLLSVSPALDEGSRAVLVSPRFSAERPIASIATMLSSRGHSLVLAVALSNHSVPVTGDQVRHITLS